MEKCDRTKKGDKLRVIHLEKLSKVYLFRFLSVSLHLWREGYSSPLGTRRASATRVLQPASGEVKKSFLHLPCLKFIQLKNIQPAKVPYFGAAYPECCHSPIWNFPKKWWVGSLSHNPLNQSQCWEWVTSTVVSRFRGWWYRWETTPTYVKSLYSISNQAFNKGHFYRNKRKTKVNG